MSSDTTRYSIPFTPLTERISVEAPQLVAPLASLRQAMGDHDFEQYIDSLISLRKVDNQLLLITKREMHRSILMSRYLTKLMETFEVEYVRIVSQ